MIKATATAAVVAAVTATPEADFAEYMRAHGKVYDSAEVYHRFVTYKENMAQINAHNEQNAEWTAGVNQFTDMTAMEFQSTMLGYKHVEGERNFADLSGLEAADDVDWTTKGAVTPVKDQGQCGSCWAFSTTGSLEGANFLSTGTLLSLSEQQLVDCAGSAGNQGCNGGLMDNAFTYLESAGSILESDYAYTARDGTCQASSKTTAVTPSSHTDVPTSESALETAVTQQPVSIAVDATTWQFYSSGIYSGCSSRVQLDHGVLAVGYSGDEYWKVKNSWATSWGEQGFIRLKKGTNECGLTNAASWPTV